MISTLFSSGTGRALSVMGTHLEQESAGLSSGVLLPGWGWLGPTFPILLPGSFEMWEGSCCGLGELPVLNQNYPGRPAGPSLESSLSMELSGPAGYWKHWDPEETFLAISSSLFILRVKKCDSGSRSDLVEVTHGVKGKARIQIRSANPSLVFYWLGNIYIYSVSSVHLWLISQET